MSFPDFPFDFSGNFSQIGSGMSSSGSVKRKAEESESEEDKKAACLAEQRFNGSDIEEPPSKRRKVVERGQRERDKMEEDGETSQQEDSQMMVDSQAALLSEETKNQELLSKKEIDNSNLMPFTFRSSDDFFNEWQKEDDRFSTSDDIFNDWKAKINDWGEEDRVITEEPSEKPWEFFDQPNAPKEEGIATTEELWQFLKQSLPKMMHESYFYLEETPIHKDIIKELLKNRPDDSLDRLYARQTILCQDGQQIKITGFEKVLLEQKSPVLKPILQDNLFEEADSQNSISWSIDQKILKIFLKSLYQPNIVLDEQKELNEEEKEKIFIALLDQANLWEAKELKRDLISWFQKKLSLLDPQKDKDFAKIVEWQKFACSKGLTSLQKNCEDLLIKAVLSAKDHQKKRNLIETLKTIPMPITQFDISAYSKDLSNDYLRQVVDLIKELSLERKDLPKEKLADIRIEEVNLGSCPWSTDEVLALLKDLPLKKLTIVDARITDNSLIHLKNTPLATSLEELSLPRSDLTDEKLIHFQHFKNLRVLDLSHSSVRGTITGTGLIHLQSLPLQKLILAGYNNLRDESITHLKHFTNLEMLDLGIAQLGKDSLAPLADLSNLRILRLDIPGDINWTHLKKLSLEELHLRTNSKVVSNDLKNLEELPLRKLSLRSGSGIEDAALTHLQKLPLEKLSISDLSESLTNAGIAHLGHLSSLRKLKLEGENLTGNCLIHLQKLSRLEELSCDVRTIQAGDLGNLEGLPLIKLFLTGHKGIEDDALIDLNKLHLEELKIHDYNHHDPHNALTNAGIAYLGDLSSLKKLSLEGENFTGDCLIHLQKLSHLEELSCNFRTIKAGDLGNLKGLPLIKLSLITETGIENNALIDLNKLQLEELVLYDRYNLSNPGVAYLGDLSSLKKLTLVGDNLTESCMRYLLKLSHLEEFSHNFSIEDNNRYLTDLKEKFPLLKITQRI